MRRLWFALVPTFLLISPAAEATASLAPASVSLSIGYSSELGPEVRDYTVVPSISALWPLRSHLAVYSAASYLQASEVPNVGHTTTGYVPRAESLTRTSHFLPVSAGIRLSVGPSIGSHGLFVEAGPAAYFARMDSGEGAVLPGVQAGAGVRFHAFGASHGEIGMSYYRSASAREDDPWSPSSIDEANVYVLHATIGVTL